MVVLRYTIVAAKTEKVWASFKRARQEDSACRPRDRRGLYGALYVGAAAHQGRGMRLLLRCLLRESERQELPMTNRNRPPARRSTRPGRTSRRVWVNTDVDLTLVVDTLQIVNLLTVAAEFMLFDSTILQVVVADLAMSFTPTASANVRRVRWALETGKDTLDSPDIESIIGLTIGPSWLYTSGGSVNISNAQVPQNIDLLRGQADIRVKAKRRFRENDSTLWLIIQNNMSAGDASIKFTGMFRTLLLIP